MVEKYEENHCFILCIYFEACFLDWKHLNDKHDAEKVANVGSEI